jgi:hypothetical protein
MKVRRVVLLTREHAVIHLTPSWLARLLGAKDLVVELEYDYPNWVSRYTRERLGWIKHSTIIKAAMEAYPLEQSPAVDEAGVVSLPRAKLHKE